MNTVKIPDNVPKDMEIFYLVGYYYKGDISFFLQVFFSILNSGLRLECARECGGPEELEDALEGYLEEKKALRCLKLGAKNAKKRVSK